MQKRITESTVLFISIIKWVVLATIAGAVVGLATTFFLKLLTLATELSHQWSYWYWLLPVALFLSTVLVKYLAPEAKGHGTEKVIEAIHKRAGKIPILVVPVKLLATIITLAFGGSAGKEGPCAQIGAGITSLFGDLLRFDDHDRKKLVICGISAGFAAVFGTPISGSIFGVEVLFVGAILYDVLLPSFIAGITAYQVSTSFGITYFQHPVSLVPVFSEGFLIKVMIAGVFFGICSIILIEVLKFMEKGSERIKIWSPLKGLLGGFILIGLSYIFSTRYLGLGLDTIEASLKGQPTEWYAFLVKPLFTGTAAGSFFAQITGLNVATFAAIGMVAVLSGSANTPIAASIMSVELFGPSVAPYATVACVISFLMTGHRSVYPSQVLSISKSPSLQVELGKELEAVQTTYLAKDSGVISRFLRSIKKIEDLVNKIQLDIASRRRNHKNTTPKSKE